MPTNRTAANVPTPIAPPASTLGTPATPFPTPVAAGMSSLFNQAVQALALLSQTGGGGYGILAGGTLSSPGTTQIVVAPGLFLGEGVLELVASSPAGSGPVKQVLAPNPYTLPDAMTSFVWLTKTGSLVSATTTTYPAQAKWFLGTVTCAGGVVTVIDTSGVMSVAGGQFSRTTADTGIPGDTPGAAFQFVTVTPGGSYLWTGAAYVPLWTTRTVALVDAATVTPNAGTTDIGTLATLSQDSTIANPTGTPYNGQILALRIKSTSVRNLTWGAQYRGSTDTALPSATTGGGKTDRLWFEWNSADSKWDLTRKNFGYT